MKIILVSRTYPAENSYMGGIPAYTYNLAHGLTQFGHDVHVVTFSPAGDDSFRDGRVWVHRTSICMSKMFSSFGKIPFVRVFLYRLRTRKKIDELIKKHEIQIVEFPDWVAQGIFIVVNKISARCVCRVHSLSGEIFEKVSFFSNMRCKILCWLERVTIEKSDVVVAATDYHAKKTCDLYHIPLSKIKVVPLGTRIPPLAQCFVRNAASSINVLYVGRLEERKGSKFLIEAIVKVLAVAPNVNFSLVGKDKDDTFQKLFKQITESRLHARVSFCGQVPYNDISGYYRECDIFVSPSLSETFGLTFVEAMSYGKPVVGFNVSGLPSIIEHEKNGLLVDPRSSEKLAEAIIHLAVDHDKRNKMGAYGRVLAERRFSVDTMAMNMEALYKSCLRE